MNSRIYSRTFINGNVRTETKNNPSGLMVDIESTRFGKEGTVATIGFESAPNRFLKLNGYEARALFESLSRHYDQLIYND